MAWLSRILAPVTFSPQCRGAVKYASSLARHFRSELTLLYVVPPVASYAEAVAYADHPALTASRFKQAEEDLHGFHDDDCPEITVVHKVLEGDPAQNIIDYAADSQTELIVMATHGYGPFRRFLLGSVTAKVLQECRCPVWTGSHMERAVNMKEIVYKRILCAIDLQDGSVAVLEWAEQMARHFNAGLAVLHVLPGSTQLGEIYFDETWRAQATEAARIALQTIRPGLDSHAELEVTVGDAPSAIREFASRWHADLLVIGRGGHEGPGAGLHFNAHAIVRESPCPVVTV